MGGMEDIHPLKTFRERHDPPLSQQQLAEELNVARETVTRWETGARKIDDEILPKVAEFTGIHPGRLRPDLAALLGMKKAR